MHAKRSNLLSVKGKRDAGNQRYGGLQYWSHMTGIWYTEDLPNSSHIKCIKYGNVGRVWLTNYALIVHKNAGHSAGTVYQS